MIYQTKFQKFIIIYVISIKMILAHKYSGYNSTQIDNGVNALNFDCPLGTYFSTHAHPYDCTSFIICNNGIATKNYCSPETNFDKNIKICIEKHKARCVDTKKEPENINNVTHNDKITCQRKLVGVFPHPFSNKKYLKCINGRLYVKSCRSGQVFHLNHKMCENFVDNMMAILPLQNTIESEKNNTLNYLKCPKNLSGNYVYPFDCHQYIKCHLSHTQIVKCSSDQVFNFRQEKCMPETLKDINEHIECRKQKKSNRPKAQFSIPLGIYCSPEGTKAYPYADNWHRYVLCENGKLKMKWCPKNQVFIPEERKCANEKDALDYIA